MSSIFACDLGLNRKTLSRNFFCCFVFRFREIFFNQHWRQMRASLILLFGKTKAFFGKDTARKKTAFLHTLFVENERETSKLKWGAMFFYKVEGHMPKLSSFGRGKKFRPKKSLTSLLHAALQFSGAPLALGLLTGDYFRASVRVWHSPTIPAENKRPLVVYLCCTQRYFD